MNAEEGLAVIVACITITAACIAFLAWAYRTKRDSEIQRTFVWDMATNHLPHIYHGMRLLMHKQDITWSEPPPIQFIQINGKKGRH